MAFDYDLFVIGAGSGGVRAARMAANKGARVACAEDTFLGGTCVNVGCVPKKLFVYGSHFAQDFDDAAAYGWQLGEGTFDWPTLRDNKTREIERLNGIYGSLLDGAGVDLINGTARLSGAQEVTVGDTAYSAERILVATGSRPFVPAFPGSEHVSVSDDAFYLPTFPRRVLVVGGGYIAVEFAGIFNGLGADVSLAYRGDLFLRGFDDGVREFVADELRGAGIDLRFNCSVAAVEPEGEARRVRFADGDAETFDLVLYATGRVPRTQGLGLEDVGVELTGSGAISVDDGFRSSVPSIYALGDVIDRFQLTPVAIAEAMWLTDELFGEAPAGPMDYADIATAVFCQPNIGTVGLTEAQARAQFGEVDVYESRFRPMKHTLSGREERSLMKLIVDLGSDRVVGIHMVGAEAGEIIQGLGVAVKARATKAQFDATMAIHPTAAEEFVTMREKRA
ncbi:MAG: glutathione-disulfide reductase [Pseudomonadota bacterium]